MPFPMSKLLAAGAVAIGTLVALPGLPALAQQAPAQQTPPQGEREQVVVAMVRVRDLMTPAERQSYRQAMREARDPAAKQRVREQMMERINQRAAKHGVVMIIDAPVMRPEMRSSAENRHPAPVRPAEVAVRPPPPRAP
ncbi:exported hypothetical protein [Azospirillaceae bacterium]